MTITLGIQIAIRIAATIRIAIMIRIWTTITITIVIMMITVRITITFWRDATLDWKNAYSRNADVKPILKPRGRRVKPLQPDEF